MNKSKYDTKTVQELLKTHSILEVATILGCHQSTVCRIVNRSGEKVERTKEEKTTIVSRIRKDCYRAERRRSLFGFEQKTNLKLYSNKPRLKLKYCLKRKGYLFLKRGDNTAYFNEGTRRDMTYEARGRKLGMDFMPIEITES